MANNGKGKYLDQALVTRYCRRQTRLNKLGKAQKARGDLIKKLMLEDGLLCPKRGPSLVYISQPMSKEKPEPVNWERAYEKVAKKLWPNSWKRRKNEMIGNQPISPSVPLAPSLKTELNPDYRVVEEEA